jgi:RimJ/RimL family protein N-acetyltransferase
MVRYTDRDGRLTDAVGDLLAWRDGALTVRTRRGDVEVAETSIAAGQPVPEPTLRYAADIASLPLHRIAARGWRPPHTAWLGGWLLRAGAAAPADAVLPLGDPGRPLDDALDAVRAWYAEHDATARFACPLPDAADLDAALARRSWRADGETALLVGDVDAVLERCADARDAIEPQLADAPPPAWVEAYARGRPASASDRAVLTDHDRAVFAWIASTDGSTALAIARGVVDGDWIGLTAVEVAPDSRRSGFARSVSHAVIVWGAHRGARHVYARVDADDPAAVALAERMALVPRARSRYRLPPEQWRAP